jgi:hypothetical protein
MNTFESFEPQPGTPVSGLSRSRIRFSLVLTLVGLLLFMIGTKPGLFGLDRSPVVGFIQLSIFTVGMGIICLGGYIGLTGFWKNGNRTIAADIGARLVATGYVVAAFSGMADVFGMGGQVYPRLNYFGPWQAIGVQAGEILIAIGFLLLLPFKYKMKTPPPAQPKNSK